MENEEVVNTPLTTEQVEETTTTEDVTKEEVTPDEPKAGDKTPPNALLESLQNEREKRRELEEKIKQLETTSISSDDEVFSDEGLALKKEISSLKTELAEIKNENVKQGVLNDDPIVKEHSQEFEEFCSDPDNAGMSLATAARVFKVEKGLTGTTRKGLEKPTGGDKQPVTLGKMSAKDAEKLRKTDFRKYKDMLQKKQLIIEE